MKTWIFLYLSLPKDFRDEEQGFPISVIVLRYGSLYRLLSFCGRYPQPRNGTKSGSHQRQGAFLLIENGQLPACSIA